MISCYIKIGLSADSIHCHLFCLKTAQFTNIKSLLLTHLLYRFTMLVSTGSQRMLPTLTLPEFEYIE